MLVVTSQLARITGIMLIAVASGLLSMKLRSIDAGNQGIRMDEFRRGTERASRIDVAAEQREGRLLRLRPDR